MVLGVGGYSNKAKGNSIHRTAETVGLQQGEGVGGGGGAGLLQHKRQQRQTLRGNNALALYVGHLSSFLPTGGKKKPLVCSR